MFSQQWKSQRQPQDRFLPLRLYRYLQVPSMRQFLSDGYAGKRMEHPAMDPEWVASYLQYGLPRHNCRKGIGKKNLFFSSPIFFPEKNERQL